MFKFKAVLFDFDGVLGKTMEDNFNAWKSAVGDYGIHIKPDDYYPLEGLKISEVPAKLFECYGQKVLDPAEIVRKKEEYYLKNNHFELYPGVVDLLDNLKAISIPVAVVSAALRARLTVSCPPGFLEKFDAIVTSDDKCEGKPSPAPYLMAAQKLNVLASECLVVENAPLGVRSAKEAGCYCIALCTTMGEKYLSNADEIYQSFLELSNSKTIKQIF